MKYLRQRSNVSKGWALGNVILICWFSWHQWFSDEISGLVYIIGICLLFVRREKDDLRRD